MSSLSIRSLPKEVEKALIREARTARKTKTEIVLEALQNRFHLGEREQKKRKVRDFFGKMSRKDYETFKHATKDFSKVEEELWR